MNGAGRRSHAIYSKWFSEYTSSTPNVEINYQSIGSGGGIGRFSSRRCFWRRRTDERRAAFKGPGAPPAFPDGPWGRCAGLQSPRCDRRAEVHRPSPRRYLSRKNQAMERSPTRQGQSRRQAASLRHHRRPPLRGFRHHLHLGGLPCQGLAGMGKESGRERLGQLADRRRWKGQRGGVWPRHANAGVDWVRRAHLRAAEQDQLRGRAEPGRRIRERRHQLGDRRCGGGRADHAEGFPGLDHERSWTEVYRYPPYVDPARSERQSAHA